jgi:hypothetical protein
MTTGDLLSCAGDYHPVDVAADQHHGGLFWQARQKVTREADCLALVQNQCRLLGGAERIRTWYQRA